MKKYGFLFVLITLVVPLAASAAVAPVFPKVTAKGIAIYGWKDDVATPIYVKNEHAVLPIASLTKLITAQTVEELYKPDDVFTISNLAASTEGTIPGIVAGAQFVRDDLLKALLVSSSNDAAVAFTEPAGTKTFLQKMNDILHVNNYTATSFINPSGLDPVKKSPLKPNRMTPYHLTILLNDIYQHNPLLRSIMSQGSAEITDLTTHTVVPLKQTNALYRDDNYKDKILMSKTGLTNSAGQNLAFVAPSDTPTYNYFTVVFLGSKSRNVDSRKILDWLDTTQQQLGG